MNNNYFLDKYTIEKINLPYYISPQKLLNNMKQLDVDDLQTYLNTIYKCIAATQNRVKQMNSLKVQISVIIYYTY